MSAQRDLADVLPTGRVIAVVTIGRAADALALAARVCHRVPRSPILSNRRRRR